MTSSISTACPVGADVAVRINVDAVPELGRPDAVSAVVAEATELRTRLRQAREELAAAQAELERQERSDIEGAAQAIRSGKPPASLSPQITKQRNQVEIAERTTSALDLATRAAEDDLASVLLAQADVWQKTLDGELAKARQRALKALTSFEQAASELTAAASAGLWLVSAAADGRLDRRVPLALDGTVARSSARVSANSEPFRLDQIVSWARELIDPPQAPVAPQLGVPAGQRGPFAR
jgi:hypothetical protein